MNSIILTGASRGLGHELHKLLVRKDLPEGQRIFISRKPLRETYEGGQYIQADLGKKSDLDVNLKISSSSKIVVFISNASTIEPIGMAVNISVSDMEEALQINCIGPLVFAQRLAVETKKVGARLFILNVSSGAAHRPIKGWMTYCTSKAAAVMALDVLAAENDHVEVKNFDPGVMDTDMQSHIRQQTIDTMPDVDLFKDYQKNSNLKSPKEVADHIFTIVRDAVQ